MVDPRDRERARRVGAELGEPGSLADGHRDRVERDVRHSRAREVEADVSGVVDRAAQGGRRGVGGRAGDADQQQAGGPGERRDHGREGKDAMGRERTTKAQEPRRESRIETRSAGYRAVARAGSLHPDRSVRKRFPRAPRALESPPPEPAMRPLTTRVLLVPPARRRLRQCVLRARAQARGRGRACRGDGRDPRSLSRGVEGVARGR